MRRSYGYGRRRYGGSRFGRKRIGRRVKGRLLLGIIIVAFLLFLLGNRDTAANIGAGTGRAAGIVVYDAVDIVGSSIINVVSYAWETTGGRGQRHTNENNASQTLDWTGS